MLQEMIAQVVQRHNLSREQAAAVMLEIMSGEATPAQIGGFLVALNMKGETIDEITGFAETMRRMATPIPTTRSPLVDTCGTGGDHSHTFNISTTAAFVLAGAGVPVAKHGNRSATSQCGSADVLEALGINIEATPQTVGKCIDTVGIGFLFARKLHGAMKHVAAPRTELRIRTIFNMLGPLTNPANASGQLMGVYDAARIEPLARVLANLGSRHAFVVAGSDGLDEVTLSGPSHVAEAHGGEVSVYEVTPEQFGLARADKTAIVGGDAHQNAAILKDILHGKQGPHRNIVLLNAAPALIAGERAQTWEEGLQIAQESIDSGKAWAVLEKLIEASHDS